MTATTVNGRAVLAVEPAPSPLSRPGRPVYYKQIMRLLLDDDTVVFGCLHCDFTGPSHEIVRPHLRKHGAPKAPRNERSKIGNLTLTDLIRRVAELEQISGDRDRWKTRCLEAERKLAMLKKALT